jgi:hypothetical protein
MYQVDRLLHLLIFNVIRAEVRKMQAAYSEKRESYNAKKFPEPSTTTPVEKEKEVAKEKLRKKSSVEKKRTEKTDKERSL